MIKTKKIFVAIVCMMVVAASSIATFASVSYANYFKSWETSSMSKCYFSFIAAHEIQHGEAYCSQAGKHVKQAYVIAYNSKKSSGRKYSTVATSKNDTTRRQTPVASVKKLWYSIEYTKYGYSTFK